MRTRRKFRRRVTIHLVLHKLNRHIPLFDRLCVVAVVLTGLWVTGEALTWSHVSELVIISLAEHVSRVVGES